MHETLHARSAARAAASPSPAVGVLVLPLIYSDAAPVARRLGRERRHRRMDGEVYVAAPYGRLRSRGKTIGEGPRRIRVRLRHFPQDARRLLEGRRVDLQEVQVDVDFTSTRLKL